MWLSSMGSRWGEKSGWGVGYGVYNSMGREVECSDWS